MTNENEFSLRITGDIANLRLAKSRDSDGSIDTEFYCGKDASGHPFVAARARTLDGLHGAIRRAERYILDVP